LLSFRATRAEAPRRNGRILRLKTRVEMPTLTSLLGSGKAREIHEVFSISQHTPRIEPSYPSSDIDIRLTGYSKLMNFPTLITSFEFTGADVETTLYLPCCFFSSNCNLWWQLPPHCGGSCHHRLQQLLILREPPSSSELPRQTIKKMQCNTYRDFARPTVMSEKTRHASCY
jgi:hypothetical protein